MPIFALGAPDFRDFCLFDPFFLSFWLFCAFSSWRRLSLWSFLSFSFVVFCWSAWCFLVIFDQGCSYLAPFVLLCLTFFAFSLVFSCGLLVAPCILRLVGGILCVFRCFLVIFCPFHELQAPLPLLVLPWFCSSLLH